MTALYKRRSLELLAPFWREDPAECGRALAAVLSLLGPLAVATSERSEAQAAEADRRIAELAVRIDAGMPVDVGQYAERAATFERLQRSVRKMLETMRTKGLFAQAPRPLTATEFALCCRAQARQLRQMGTAHAREGADSFDATAESVEGADLLHGVILRGELERVYQRARAA